MKRTLLLLATSLLFTGAFAQKFSLNQGGPAGEHYYEELPYENVNGKLILQVAIAGKTYKFLLDTGAPTAISRELQKVLNTSVLRQGLARDAYGNMDSISVVKLEHIQLGNIDFTGIPAITHFPDFFKCWGIEGVIGSNMLRKSIVSIRDDKHVLIITDQPDKLTLDPKHSVPLMTGGSDQSDPIIRIRMNDKEDIDLGFDTGDNGLLRITEDMANKLKARKVGEQLARGYGANSLGEFGAQKSADKYRIKFSSLNIGTAQLTHVITETNKQAIPGIGTRLLEYGAVTLDFIHGKFYFDPYKESNDLTEKQWTLSPSMNGNKLIVGVVWETDTHDIRPGQQITTINGVDFSTVTLCDIATRKSILAGMDTATLTIKDEKGNEKTVQISKQ